MPCVGLSTAAGRLPLPVPARWVPLWHHPTFDLFFQLEDLIESLLDCFTAGKGELPFPRQLTR
jgi:hypothetical protein